MKLSKVADQAAALLGREVAVTYRLVGRHGYAQDPVTIRGRLIAIGAKVETFRKPPCLVIDATPSDARPDRTGGVPIIALRSVLSVVAADEDERGQQ